MAKRRAELICALLGNGVWPNLRFLLVPSPLEWMNLRGMSALARVDWFHRTEKKHFTRDVAADGTYSFDAPVDATLEQLLAQGYALGIPKGSNRGGCFELQTALGIWSSPRGSRLNPRTAIFRSWEQLEAEEG